MINISSLLNSSFLSGGVTYVPIIAPEKIDVNINIIILGKNILGVINLFIVKNKYIKNEINITIIDKINIVINNFSVKPNSFDIKIGALLLLSRVRL
jgi:hypothetical protein